MKTTLTFLFGMIFLISLSAEAQEAPQKATQNDFINGDMIVQLIENSDMRDVISQAPPSFNLTIGSQLSHTANIWLVKFDHNAVSHENLKYWMYSQKNVEIVQNNYYLELRSTLPGDPSFTSQWHHNNTGQTGGTSDADIDSDLAWDITTGGTTASGHDIVLCLIESGNLDHQDIDPNRWFNAGEIPNNGVDDDGNGYVDDYDGWNPVANNDNPGTGAHGTNCLGMMGAKGDNGLNVVGANWDVKLMVVGGYNINTDANAIAAYQYPYDMRVLWNTSGGTEGAFVVATSSSWGIDAEDQNNHPIWCNFYATMGEAGILNVGATTNSNLDVDAVGDMPTGCATQYMIGVGRTDHNDNTQGGYGDQTIAFGAPGVNVVTTAGTNGITTTTGTSFSCPLTAGVIGLAYSIPCPNFMDLVIADPQNGADLVLQAMLDGVDVKAQLANKFMTGGRLNSFNTIDNLMAETCIIDICGMTTVSTVVEPSCAGIDDGSISVVVTGGTPGYTYDWGVAGGDVDNIGTLGDGLYELVISDGASCDTTINYTLTYNTEITGSINSNDISCNGLTDGDATASATGGTSYTYQWVVGPAGDAYTNLGAGDYTVNITDVPTGCSVQEVVTIVEPGLPTINFSWSSAFLDVTFNPTLTGGTYSWDFGDSNSSTDQSPSHSYATGGTYTVCLDYTTDCGTYQKCRDLVVVMQDNSSITENAADYVSVYPNPANSIVNFKVTSANMVELEIVDVVGKVIVSKRIDSETTTIDVENFDGGTYFYKILGRDGNTLLTNKIIVAK